MATKYFARRPITHKGHHYRPGDEITGFTGWWRYWQYLRYAAVNQVDTAGAPVINSITPGDTILTLAVTTDPTGEDPFTNFEYKLDAGSWIPFLPVDTASPFVIEGLTNGQLYSVKVRADNAAGTGTESEVATGTPRTVPDAPDNLVATPGDGQLSIAFTVADNGGSAITNFEYRVMPSTTYIPFDPADNSAPVVVTGLENDVEVQIFIRAVNAAGVSAGASVTSTPVGSPPDAPSALVATPSALACSIAFVAPNLNGGTLVEYQHSFNDGTDWFGTTPDTIESPYLLTMPAADYTVVLRAVTSVGEGPKSAPVTFTVPAA